MAWVNLNTIYATKSEVNSKVPNTRTINGKALSSNVTLGASDIKLSNNTTLQSAWDSISSTVKGIKSKTDKLNIDKYVAGVAFHAWDNGFQIRSDGANGLPYFIATFDSNGINFYKNGNYTWHR